MNVKHPLLTVKNLRKTYRSPLPVEILKQVDLEVYPEEAIAILGKSGEGKSTLLHLLGFLDLPTEGTITIEGDHNLYHLRNQTIGFIFQHAHLLEEETLLNNVLMPAKISRISTDKTSPAYLRALLLIDKVGLSHRLHFPAKVLSGGERQRAAIARALINSPALILADEPSGNLDSVHSQEIQSLLLSCVKDEKKSLIIVTHDADFAQKCDRTFLLKDGVLLPNPLYLSPL